jgi:hypothetical protein
MDIVMDMGYEFENIHAYQLRNGLANTVAGVANYLAELWKWDHKNLICFTFVEIPRIEVAVQRRRNESAEHQLMKHAGMAWLLSQGLADAKQEGHTPAGRADVCSEAARIAVECGYSHRGKLHCYLESGWRMLDMPYSFDWMDLDPKPPRAFLGILFSLSDGVRLNEIVRLCTYVSGPRCLSNQ